MPLQQVNGVRLYYELHGLGPPLALFPGLGGNIAMWNPDVIDALARHHQVLIFDNRGTGRSDKPDEPYSIKLFADDAAALLAKLGLKRIHVLGASMGGMTAQQFALDYAERVDRLILCCTTAGGSEATAPELDVLAAIANTEGLAPAEAARVSWRFAYHPTFLASHEDYLEQRLEPELEYPTPPFTLARHFEAAVRFDVTDRVGSIRARTLVLVGREDQMVPAANSLWLSRQIPNADLVVYGNAGHAFMTERRIDVTRDIIDFLGS